MTGAELEAMTCFRVELAIERVGGTRVRAYWMTALDPYDALDRAHRIGREIHGTASLIAFRILDRHAASVHVHGR